jgi:hypothetical protein
MRGPRRLYVRHEPCIDKEKGRQEIELHSHRTNTLGVFIFLKLLNSTLTRVALYNISGYGIQLVALVVLEIVVVPNVKLL